MKQYAPIVITVYDRLNHLRHCINALLKNPIASRSDLIIISDAAYKEADIQTIQQVRNYIQGIIGFNHVEPLIREQNMGAHQSLINGIDNVLSKYDSFILLEDDIVVSPNFLQYMNDGLEFYKNEKSIFSICAFKLPFDMPADYKKETFFYPCNSPWGIATWKDRWLSVDHNYFDRYTELKKKGLLKSFCSIGFYIKGILKADSNKTIIADDLRVYYHMFQNNMASVFPTISKSQNWGFDGSGEHCGDNDKAWWAKPDLDMTDQKIAFEPFSSFDKNILKQQRKFQDKINGGLLAKHLKYTWVHDLYKRMKSII